MKTEQEIREEISRLETKLAKPICPCGCEDDGWDATLSERRTLYWVLGENSKHMTPTRSESGA